MKILEKVSRQILEVYGIYWYGNKTFFCCFPRTGMGMSCYAEDEVEIVDPAVGVENEFRVTGNGLSGVFNRHLLNGNLLDDLLEGDPEAFERFVSLIGKMPN